MNPTNGEHATSGAPGSYGPVTGPSMYYEEHGAGEPLILLHGGVGAHEMFGPHRPLEPGPPLSHAR
jgi:hypothetical protein